MMNNHINCCPSCDNPVMLTMIIPYAEWFCLKCNWSGGLFNAEWKDETPERKAKWASDWKKFKKISKHYIPPRSGRVGCKKCNLGEHKYHLDHLTPKQMEKHLEAKKSLGLKIIKPRNK